MRLILLSILLVPCVAYSLDPRLSNKVANSSEEYEIYRLADIDSKSNAEVALHECVLGSSGAYLLMEWTDRDKLGKFRRKFATIANLKAKTERALSKSGQFSKNYRDKNRRYIKNIQQLQEYAIAFRSYTISQGRNNDAALLDNLIDCRN